MRTALAPQMPLLFFPMQKAIKTKKKTFKLQDRYRFQKLPIAVENKAGSIRRSMPGEKPVWKTEMGYDYGYIVNTMASDGEGVDTYVNRKSKGMRENYHQKEGEPDQIPTDVYVVHQLKIWHSGNWNNGICPDCKKHHSECTCPKHYDEDKVMLGFSSKEEAIKAYLKQYDSPRFLGPVSTYTIDEFNAVLKRSWGKKLPSKNGEYEHWHGFDLDGTAAKDDGFKGREYIGPPIKKTIARIRQLLDQGKKVKILTARAVDKKAIPPIQEWMKNNNIPLLEITNEKDPGMISLEDDRAVQVRKNTGNLVKSISTTYYFDLDKYYGKEMAKAHRMQKYSVIKSNNKQTKKSLTSWLATQEVRRQDSLMTEKKIVEKTEYITESQLRKKIDEMYKADGMKGESREEYIKRAMKELTEKQNKVIRPSKVIVVKKSYPGQPGDPGGSFAILRENIVKKPYSVKKAPKTMTDILKMIEDTYDGKANPGESEEDYFRRMSKEVSNQQVQEMLERGYGDMDKAFIRATTRHLKSGKVVTVKAHTDIRKKHEKEVISKPIISKEINRQKRAQHIKGITEKYGVLNIIPPQGTQITEGTATDKWILKFKSPKTGKEVHAYSQTFMESQAKAKFEKMAALKEVLPNLRKDIEKDIATSGLNKAKLAAVISSIIDKTYIRIGTEKNAAHGVYGITTLRNKHVTLENGRVILDYVGKHQIKQRQVIDDIRIYDIIRELKSKTGADDRIFQYDKGKIDSTIVNGYLKKYGMTAKQFRTFHATKEAFYYLENQPEAKNKTQVRNNVKEVYEHVSSLLGNTPTVAKTSYISPEIIINYQNKHSFWKEMKNGINNSEKEASFFHYLESIKDAKYTEAEQKEINDFHNQDLEDLEKAFIKATTYTNKAGKKVSRKSYFDKRQKKITHVKHKELTRVDYGKKEAKEKIEALKKKRAHHDLHIEAANDLKAKVETHKKTGNTQYAIGDKIHPISKVLKDLNDHIEHHTNEKKSHDNHVQKIEKRHETEAKHWEKKREEKKAKVVSRKEVIESMLKDGEHEGEKFGADIISVLERMGEEEREPKKVVVKKEKPYYIVSHGPDDSHHTEAPSFDKLKDAKEHLESLDKGRSAKIERHQPKGRFSTDIDKKIIVSRLHSDIQKAKEKKTQEQYLISKKKLAKLKQSKKVVVKGVTIPKEAKERSDFRENAIQTKDHIAFLHGGVSDKKNRTDLRIGQNVYMYGRGNKHKQLKIAGFKKPTKSQMSKFGDSPHDIAKHTMVMLERESFGKKEKQSVKAFKLDKDISAPDFFTSEHSTYGYTVKDLEKEKKKVVAPKEKEIKTNNNSNITMSIISKSDIKARLMYNGIKVYTHTSKDGKKMVIRSGGDRQLTEKEAKHAFKLVAGTNARFINQKFVNKYSPYEYVITK